MPEGTLERISFFDIGAADLTVRFCQSGRRHTVAVDFNEVPIFNTSIVVYHGPASPTTSSLVMTSSRAGEASVRAIVTDNCANPITSGVGLQMFRPDRTFNYSLVSLKRVEHRPGLLVLLSHPPPFLLRPTQVMAFTARFFTI